MAIAIILLRLVFYWPAVIWFVVWLYESYGLLPALIAVGVSAAISFGVALVVQDSQP